MLTREQIEEFAANYLIQNKYPIVTHGRVRLPGDQIDEKTKNFLLKHGIAMVSFKSKYLDDPDHELEPGIYIVYVDLITGEVHMPRHMV